MVTYADFFNYMWNYPCEGGILVSVMDVESIDYIIRDIQDGQTTASTHIQYSPASPVEPEQWIRYLDWIEREPITQQEFEEILNAPVRIPVTMQPLMDYPLEEPIARSTSRHSLDFENYEDMIRMYLTNQPERWYRWEYAILDLDGNGQEELVWREDSREWVYTMDQGDLIVLLGGRDLTVCENGYVEIIQSYSGDNKTYCYYRIDGNQAVSGQSLVLQHRRQRPGCESDFDICGTGPIYSGSISPHGFDADTHCPVSLCPGISDR